VTRVSGRSGGWSAQLANTSATSAPTARSTTPQHLTVYVASAAPGACFYAGDVSLMRQ